MENKEQKELLELLEQSLSRIKNGKMKLTKPIKKIGTEEELIKEINVQESQSASFYLNMPFEEKSWGDYLDVICDVTGLHTEEVKQLHKEDYATLVLFVKK